jgi:predicted Zn-dependent protease
MNRRQWLRWGCAHCAAVGGLAAAQTNASAPWTAPPRFDKPDLATDEGGLWALMDREEKRLRRSPFRIRDEALSNYLTSIACGLGGGHCPDIRVYPIRAPFFNASMAPNGMMQIWSGLLLRVDNEAQLAAVIGHEIGHYLQRHTVERLRDLKARAAFGQFLGLFGLVGLVGQLATLAAGMAYSRDQEREADRISIELMRRQGYDPRAAAVVWGQLLDELRATPGVDPSKESVLFATHPPSAERRDTLDALAIGGDGATREAEYQARLAPHRFGLLEDEVRRGKPFESVALIDRLLKRDPDSAELRHFRGEALRARGEPGDAELALADYSAAVQTGREPAATHRALGEIYRAQGQADQARNAWRIYLERAPDAPDAGLIRQSIEQGNT